jgi:outer membrane protein assembly factor BamB
MRLKPLAAVCSIFTLIVSASAFASDNWPQWRGPNGGAAAADGEFPVKFSADDGVTWKVKLPGLGSSTPAVWGDQIFVTCLIDGQDGVVCYDMDGDEQWKKSLGNGREPKHRNGSGSNPSPATDGEHLVVYYKSGRVACLDLAGNERWQVNLQDKYGKDTLWWDLGSSPIIAGKNAVVAVMHEGQGYLVALDLATGDVAWKQDRTYERPEESDQAYTTPMLTSIDDRDVIVTWGADHLTLHDAATGELIRSRDGFNPDNEGMWRVIASAPVHDGVAIVPWGRGKFLSGILLDGEAESDELWIKEGVGADVPTPAVKDGKVYVLSDAGQIWCLDVQTGEELWSGRLPRSKDKFYSSPALAGDKLYCANEGGKIFVADVADGLEVLAENDMGEKVIATPVPVRGGLLIRGETHLFRIGGDNTKTASAGS